MLARIELTQAQPTACDEAAGWLERADQTLQKTGLRYRLPQLCELRAELARQRGDAAARDAMLREALRLYREMGAPGHLERLAREIAS